MEPGHGKHKRAAVAFRLSRFSSAYRCGLLEGLRDLQNFCSVQHDLNLEALASHPKTADAVLGEYVMQRFNEKVKSGLSKVKHALLGLQHVYPRLRGKLVTAWSNLKTWEEQRVSKLRPPLPVPIWTFALGLARAHAKVEKHSSEARLWEIFSVLLEVGLLCMLRPGELLRLTHLDVSLPGSFVMSRKHAALRVTSPKNRRQFGEHQFVLLKNQNTIAWLERIHVEGLSETIWPISMRAFGVRFRQLMHELGVEALRFSPASLRPGGATLYYHQGVPINTLRFMGRWTAEKSLEHYIQLAVATQIMNKLDAASVARLRKMGHLCIAQVLFATHQNLVRPTPSKSSTSKQLVEWCDAYAALA